MALELSGRAAVVTGAASGIGRALALETARRGMDVGVADIDANALEETAAMVRDLGARVVAQALDVRDADALRGFAANCFAAFPSIALVWANAGVIRYGAAFDAALDDWNFVLDVNLKGAVNSMAAFAAGLRDRAEPACFVITGSQASFMTVPRLGAYAASKHACWALADTLDQEFREAGTPVRAALLAPPRVATGILAATTARVREEQGEAGLAAFMATLMPPEALARFAYERVLAGDFFLLPGYDEIAEIVDRRLAPLRA